MTDRTPDTAALNLDALRTLIAVINAEARLIVHPDDEAIAREALNRLPAHVRPTLVVSPAVKEAGVAYYSKSVSMDAIGGGTITNIPRPLAPTIEEDDGDLYSTAPLTLPSGEVIAGPRAAAYRRVRARINERLGTQDPIDFLGGTT